MIGILYLVSRYFIAHQNASIQYCNYDEAAIFVVLFLAITIVTLPYFISKKSDIIYVDRLKDTSIDNNDINTKSAANEHAQLPNFTDGISKILTSEKATLVKIEKILSLLCSGIEAGQGVIYKIDNVQASVALIVSYAFVAKENQIAKYEFGEGLIGLSAKENRMMKLDNIPQGYINIFSGLGSSSPSYLYILPFNNGNDEVLGIIEIALFKDLTDKDFQLIDAAKASLVQLVPQL